MVKTTLVSLDIERGGKVVEILESAGFRLNAALWMFASEYEDWRLFLAGPAFDELGIRQSYLQLNKELEANGLALEHTPTIMILPRSDAFIRDLRKVFGKSKGVNGMRLGGQTIGGRFVEDAYVYRIS